ncbi:MAG TPA: UPF0280 family protein [Bacteroidales bacterium]|nr:UPF0280 family protein [Bacteroidales bacterium]
MILGKTGKYEPRLYRAAMGNARWRSFRAVCRETDLWVAVDADRYSIDTERFTMDRIMFYRTLLEEHIAEYPVFRDSLVPVMAPAGVHPIVRDMYEAALAAGTGPMSAVAGATAHHICNDLIAHFGFREVVIENGGDIFMKLISPATIAVFAGASPLSDKIGLVIKPEETPLAVCCSSGTVGHSLSFGIADACMISCRSGAQADAYATAFCNEVKNRDHVQRTTEMALQKPEIMSVVIIAGDKASLGGSIEVKMLKKASG